MESDDSLLFENNNRMVLNESDSEWKYQHNL